MKFPAISLALVSLLSLAPAARAWDYEGHRIVNQLALASLPKDFPDFAAKFSAGRTANIEKFPDIDETKNAEHAREWCGFAPWAITEYFGKLRATFSYLKVFEELGTPDEIANAQANALYIMGVMGHY